MFCSCFFVFFFVFFRPPKLWDNRSRERLNGFSWNFHQTIEGKCSLKRRAAAWRMANVDLRNLRYDSAAVSAAGYGNPIHRDVRYDSCGITRGRHAWRLRYTTMSGRMDVISNQNPTNSFIAICKYVRYRRTRQNMRQRACTCVVVPVRACADRLRSVIDCVFTSYTCTKNIDLTSVLSAPRALVSRPVSTNTCGYLSLGVINT